MNLTIASAKRHIESLSDEDVLREFERTWTDMAQVARAIRKVMLDALEGDDTATLALDQIASVCGVESWKSPAHVLDAVTKLRARADSATAQLEATPVMSMADRSKLASIQIVEDRVRKFDDVVAQLETVTTERDALARQLAESPRSVDRGPEAERRKRCPSCDLAYPVVHGSRWRCEECGSFGDVVGFDVCGCGDLKPKAMTKCERCLSFDDLGVLMAFARERLPKRTHSSGPTAEDIAQGLEELYGLGYSLRCNVTGTGWRMSNKEHPYQEPPSNPSTLFHKTIADAIRHVLPSWNSSTWRSRRSGDGGPPHIGDG